MPENLQNTDEQGQERTESPTEERLRELRKQGQILRPSELLGALSFTLIALLCINLHQKGWVLMKLKGVYVQLWNPEAFINLISFENWIRFWGFLGIGIAIWCAVLWGIGSAFTGFYWNPELWLPQWNRLRPRWKPWSFEQSGRGLIKMGGVILSIFVILKQSIEWIPFLVLKPFEHGIQEGFSHLRFILWILIGVLGSLSLGEIFLNWWILQKKQKMTKQEIREEQKRLEGDPLIKSKRRSLARSLVYQNIKNLSMSNFIITNPTHFSVALMYKSHLKAPVVVAKGVDELAKVIREYGQKHDIPIVESPPLARRLYAEAPLMKEIDPKFYRDVIKVIQIIYKMKGWDYFRKETQTTENSLTS